MINVINAIRTEKQLSTVYLQQLETGLEANKDYLSKVEVNFLFYLKNFFDNRLKNVNPIDYVLKLSKNI